MESTVVKVRDCEYSATRDNGTLTVKAFWPRSLNEHTKSFPATDEESARRWLGDHGLRKGKARRLLLLTATGMPVVE